MPAQPPKPRALAIDVDGTLLDPDHRVTPASREAIQALIAAEVLPVLATSRPPGAVAALLRQLDLAGRPAVTCQGAVWGSCDAAGTLHPRAIRQLSAAAAREVTASAKARGLGVSWFYADRWLAETEDPLIEQEEHVTGTSADRVPALLEGGEPPTKILVMAQPGRESHLAVVRAELPADVIGATSRADYLEVVARGVSKWSALQEVCRWQRIPLDRIAAVGDGNNDIEMITHAAIGIAMGHAPPALRQAADWVAPDNRHEGFAAAVDWLLS